MILGKIVEEIEVLKTIGRADVEITALTFDSRNIERGSMFFALRGNVSDGHTYINSAVEKGATAVVCEELPAELKEEVTYILVECSSKAMGVAASTFNGHPSRKLKLVGITGTNGKTTTAILLFDLFRGLGHKVGLISTIDYRYDEITVPSTHTTPDSIRINKMLAIMVGKGCEYCFMEVSSHAVVQHRIAGLNFAGGAFSNITHEHLDYHGTFATYIAAKKQFFDNLPKTAFALTNIDDRNGWVMVQNTKAVVKSVSMRSMADFQCKIMETHFDSMLLSIDGTQTWVKFIGRFNAYNLITVYGCARMLGANKEDVLKVISSLASVRGRFETVRSQKGITAIIDYAHTPDALQNVLDTINEIRKAGQKLFTVVGCGGDRDKTKRPVMARIAVENSDYAILTSDNPRSEDPTEILEQMKAGLNGGQIAISIIDRREAIRTAVIMAKPEDIILVAGKGHETYQIIGSETLHFDDREEVRKAFVITDLIDQKI